MKARPMRQGGNQEQGTTRLLSMRAQAVSDADDPVVEVEGIAARRRVEVEGLHMGFPTGCATSFREAEAEARVEAEGVAVEDSDETYKDAAG